ncbi:MAG: hypothetical protein DRJ15_02750 [Bacteroidetes bacterium]|nr:MAG: hypothetical protein DRI83_10170 [Bacteroidota bacterium]RLD82046.1 MAG: hypothetical protein DRJ15_02750 [Bacteroidota bacterium]
MEYKSKAALEYFLEVIRNADQTFLDPEKVIDEQGRVDGYQHIFHLLRTSIDFYLFNDPLRPDFMLLANPHHKVLGDNVDAVYYFTQVRGDQEYIVRGKRFDSCYLSFCLYGGDPDGELADRVTRNVNHRDIEFEADGSFEIKFTPDPKGRNEFKLDEDAVTLFTREYFFDRPNSSESELSVENTKLQEAPKPLDDEELARRIRMMATFFEQTTWIAPLPVDFPLNDFLPPFAFEADQGGWGTVDNIYCFGRYSLEENQYLKIRFTSPECCYWGIQTWNFLMQSTDYKNYKVCINKGNAVPGDDGSFTVCLSHRPMDVDNWISTAAYKEAIIFCRWLLAEEMPEQPTVELLEI